MDNLYTTTGGKTILREKLSSFPRGNKVFNVAAFREPERRFNSRGQEPFQRGREYGEIPMSADNGKQVGPMVRGLPQLTWFDGTYDHITGPSANNTKVCNYPDLVVYKGGKKSCIKTGKPTAAELARIAKYKKEREDAISAALAPMSDAEERRVSCLGGKTEYQRVQMVGGNTVYSYYSCATGKFLRKGYTVVVKGLGASDEDGALTTKDRVIEFALIGTLVAAAIFVGMKR